MIQFTERKRNKTSYPIFRLALSFTKGYRQPLFFCILTGILKVILGLLFIWLCKQIIDIAVAEKTGSIWFYSILLIATLLAEIITNALQSNLTTKNEVAMRNNLRQQLFSQTLNSRWNGSERHHTGEIMNRLEEDIRVVTDAWCNLIPSTITAVLQAFGAFLFLSILSSTLAWLIAGILPLTLIFIKLFGKRLKLLTEDIRKTDGKIQAIMQESLQKRVILLSLLRTQAAEDNLKREQDILYKKVLKRNRFTITNRSLMAAGFGGGYLTAFLWGAVQLQRGMVTFGMVTAFLQLVGQLQRPVADLSRRIPGLIHAMASVSRLRDLIILERESKVQDKCIAQAIQLCGIRIENVSFSYPQATRQILHRFTHDFTPGSMTAIMGETGVGKSTLTRLILGLLQPQQGSIKFYDLQQRVYIASPSTRRSILYVPQGNSLMSGTIRENLLAGNDKATEQQMYEALYDAAAEFVTELPDKLETRCGEGGAGLSEGQAQRIAIARALLSEGKIMLLDEFSSALDAITEQRLMQRLQQYRKEKTILIVTHKQEVADLCEETVRLKRV